MFGLAGNLIEVMCELMKKIEDCNCSQSKDKQVEFANFCSLLGGTWGATIGNSGTFDGLDAYEQAVKEASETIEYLEYDILDIAVVSKSMAYYNGKSIPNNVDSGWKEVRLGTGETWGPDPHVKIVHDIELSTPEIQHLNYNWTCVECTANLSPGFIFETHIRLDEIGQMYLVEEIPFKVRIDYLFDTGSSGSLYPTIDEITQDGFILKLCASFGSAKSFQFTTTLEASSGESSPVTKEGLVNECGSNQRIRSGEPQLSLFRK